MGSRKARPQCVRDGWGDQAFGRQRRTNLTSVFSRHHKPTRGLQSKQRGPNLCVDGEPHKEQVRTMMQGTVGTRQGARPGYRRQANMNHGACNKFAAHAKSTAIKFCVRQTSTSIVIPTWIWQPCLNTDAFVVEGLLGDLPCYLPATIAV